MKLFFVFLLWGLSLYGQGADSLDGLTGRYQAAVDPSLQFIIKKDNGQLILSLPGQGQTELVAQGGDRFQPNHISPPVTLSFVRDRSGQAQQFGWLQDNKGAQATWIRLSGTGYAGRYQLKNNPYKTISIQETDGHFNSRLNEGPALELSPTGPDQFSVSSGDYKMRYEFVKDKLLTREEGKLDFNRMEELVDGGFHREKGFNRADSLRGMLTALRTCYDVTFYNLDVEVIPFTQSIQGNVVMRFKVVRPFDRMQVDLYNNMKIGQILFHGQSLSYTREYNAVYITFPASLPAGKEDEITILYAGKPQLPDLTVLKGGFFWFQDRDGHPWIESVCQGSGASLWWPCKDHQSDEPDSMRISITVPRGLRDISNGRLLDTIALPGDRTRFNWYVDYPINNYNVVVNIGNYLHFSDVYNSLPLNYYCMPYDDQKAKKIFSQTKRLLALYEKDFGEYPFSKDGFTLMESLYPMEHQSAVSIGPINNPVLSDKTDYADLDRTVWHESAHEWWGNNITCKDIADIWIHEAFAQYAEFLVYESFQGKAAALKFLREQTPENKTPVIGTYNVNDFYLGDVYSKGGLMLHTLRNTLDNDTLWFNLLRGLQQQFRYQTVTTEDLVGYVNTFTHTDYTSFFDQYLRHNNIPELALALKTDGDTLEVSYKWNTDVSRFDMPIKVTTAKNRFTFIRPTADWQYIRLTGVTAADFKVDTVGFYVNVKSHQVL